MTDEELSRLKLDAARWRLIRDFCAKQGMVQLSGPSNSNMPCWTLEWEESDGETGSMYGNTPESVLHYLPEPKERA